MSGAFIASAIELEHVPDGTVISWLRIPGDSTSEAVAFVRREVEDLGPCGPYDESGTECGQRVTVWISPGGWDPQTIESAGVRFPATVVRWGIEYASEPVDPSRIPIYAVPEAQPVQAYTLDSGGGYTRVAALDAAVQLFKGDAIHWIVPSNGEGPYLQPLLDVAKEFEAHLLRDDLADAVSAIADCGLIGQEAYTAWLDRDRAAAGEPTDIVTDGDDEARYRRDGL